MQEPKPSRYLSVHESPELSVWGDQIREHGLLFLIPIVPPGQTVAAIGIELNRLIDQPGEIVVSVIPTEKALSKRSLRELNEVWLRELSPPYGRHLLQPQDELRFYEDSHPFHADAVQGAGSVILRCRLKEFDCDEINVLHALGAKASIAEKTIKTVRDIIQDYSSRALTQGPESRRIHLKALHAQLGGHSASAAARTAIM